MTKTMKKLLIYTFLLALMPILSACDGAKSSSADAPLVATDITGAEFAKPFTLTDHTGKKRSMSDFAGKVVVMFFGYTHCPDVCPTTMNDLKSTMKLLGDQSNNVQVLFVTLDPQRDTQEVLAKFVPFFDERFIGLWGSLQETAETMGNYKIFFSKVPGDSENNYTLDHSAGLYVFDKTGKVRYYMSYGQKPADMASDIKKLL
jgi:protein SCO1/2